MRRAEKVAWVAAVLFGAANLLYVWRGIEFFAGVAKAGPGDLYFGLSTGQGWAAALAFTLALLATVLRVAWHGPLAEWVAERVRLRGEHARWRRACALVAQYPTRPIGNMKALRRRTGMPEAEARALIRQAMEEAGQSYPRALDAPLPAPTERTA